MFKRQFDLKRNLKSTLVSHFKSRYQIVGRRSVLVYVEFVVCIQQDYNKDQSYHSFTPELEIESRMSCKQSAILHILPILYFPKHRVLKINCTKKISEKMTRFPVLECHFPVLEHPFLFQNVLFCFGTSFSCIKTSFSLCPVMSHRTRQNRQSKSCTVPSRHASHPGF